MRQNQQKVTQNQRDLPNAYTAILLCSAQQHMNEPNTQYDTAHIIFKFYIPVQSTVYFSCYALLKLTYVRQRQFYRALLVY